MMVITLFVPLLNIEVLVARIYPRLFEIQRTFFQFSGDRWIVIFMGTGLMQAGYNSQKISYYNGSPV
jgi:hypothetical protein